MSDEAKLQAFKQFAQRFNGTPKFIVSTSSTTAPALPPDAQALLSNYHAATPQNRELLLRLSEIMA